ncbi:ETC complex I subunit conserved region-domain-containing protein [Circinella umbellata]|nr:ETC complex I subunit conserved region-domain-containing protein [Circinella umbellata]
MLRSIATTQKTCLKPLASTMSRAFFTTTSVTLEDGKKLTRTDESRAVEYVEPVSGAPEELLERTVRIFTPSKPATQSGKFGTRHWRIEFDILPEGNRWENPLIGWASSADYEQAIAMKFYSKEDAIIFCERQGWNYYVQEPKRVKFVKKSYADNYKYCPGKLRIIKTK